VAREILCELEDERNSERTRVVRFVQAAGKIVVGQTRSSRVEVKHAAAGPKRTQSFSTEIYYVHLSLKIIEKLLIHKLGDEIDRNKTRVRSRSGRILTLSDGWLGQTYPKRPKVNSSAEQAERGGRSSMTENIQRIDHSD
jgi:hypothetical protein